MPEPDANSEAVLLQRKSLLRDLQSQHGEAQRARTDWMFSASGNRISMHKSLCWNGIAHENRS